MHCTLHQSLPGFLGLSALHCAPWPDRAASLAARALGRELRARAPVQHAKHTHMGSPDD